MKFIRKPGVILVGIVLIVMIGVAGALRQGLTIDRLEDSIRDGLNPSQNVFRDTEFGISFRYPKNWKERFVAPDMILFSQEDGEATMTLVLKKRKEAETLQQVTEKNLQEIEDSSTSVNQKGDIDGVLHTYLGSLAADQVSFHTMKNDVRIDGIQMWTVQDTREYFVTFTARSDQFKTAVQTFDSVLQSLQIK